jgi:hypothetical protein
VDGSPYRTDAALAALTDPEVETRWRQALASDDREMVVVLARQLVLRALPLIEETCQLRAERAGLDQCECEHAIEEASMKLLLRLLHDNSWSSLGALAAGIARTCLDQPRRRRSAIGFVPLRPRLRIVPRGGRQQERGDHHGSC